MHGLLAVTEVAGVGLPLALVLLVPMAAGVPIPNPDDLVMLLVGERVAARALPWWVGVLALGVVLVAGAAVFWLVCRGRRAGTEAWAEAACPACLALGAAGERLLHAHLVPRVEAEPSPG